MAKFIKAKKAVKNKDGGKLYNFVEIIINIDQIRFIENYSGNALVYFSDGEFNMSEPNDYNPLLLDETFEKFCDIISASPELSTGSNDSLSDQK